MLQAQRDKTDYCYAPPYIFLYDDDDDDGDGAF